MTVKRFPDPAGLLPDLVQVEPDGSKEDDAAIKALLKNATPRARIENLKRHEYMRAEAMRLEALLKDGQADPLLLTEIAAAETRALHLRVSPIASRDAKRQAGTKESRRGQMPTLDRWLAVQDLTKSADQLFWALPESHADSALYRDGNEAKNRRICEQNKFGKEKCIGFKAFQERLTKARKNPA